MLRKGRGMYSQIPFPKVENRPLIVSHPGAYHNYLASWNVMVDNQQPFVLVCDEMSPTYPDDVGWGMFSQDGREYFARVDNPIGIGQSYRNPDLSFQNLVIHRHKCAKLGMEDFPFIDVMYTDFPELFTTYTEDRKHPLLKAAPLLSSKVRDGGLIIFDKKNLIIINDSKSTSFASSENVLKILDDAYWILGGIPKKGEIVKLKSLEFEIKDVTETKIETLSLMIRN